MNLVRLLISVRIVSEAVEKKLLSACRKRRNCNRRGYKK